MLKSRGSGVGKSDPLDDMIRSMIKHVNRERIGRLHRKIGPSNDSRQSLEILMSWRWVSNVPSMKEVFQV